MEYLVNSLGPMGLMLHTCSKIEVTHVDIISIAMR